ncbi:TetR/AcrR family transcriptional regulator [Paenibacillus qinlingensis]|uniref:TetR/AcrR family transcriptional regulator n=1 Tax=Paenibacillus qinlingensis TaxID=1837343 RepID=UPI0015663AF8|nr:TetR/AcrR family transcriptional regulator [Paenibacillus qinlingensis]NQX60003.1 TetR/AcrR family transcriptional regulator [Paenibacillus qinlingensis]
MPKFTEQEKEHIRHSLLSNGKALFAAQGLSKTSIDEIVLACGIAKGSFYKFFATKEELYWDILMNEETIRNQLLQELSKQDRSPKELVVGLLKRAFEMADKNQFLQPIFEKGEYERLLRKLPEHIRVRASETNRSTGAAVIRNLINRDQLSEEDPQVISGILHAVMLLRLHKEQLGADLFPLIIDRIIDYVAEGLTNGNSDNIIIDPHQ